MNATLAILGSSVITALVMTIVNGLFSKRKLSADATQVLTQAASGIVERLEEENRRIVANNTRLTERVTQLEREMRRWRGIVLGHQEWDREAARKLRAKGIQIADPPPLLAE